MELSKVSKPVKSLMTLNHDDGLKGGNGLSVGPVAILARRLLPLARMPMSRRPWSGRSRPTTGR